MKYRYLSILALVISAPAFAVYGGGDKTEANAAALAGAAAEATGVGVGIGKGGDGGKGLGVGLGGEGGKAVGGGGYGAGGDATGGAASSNSEGSRSTSASGNGDQISTNINNYREVFRAPYMDSQTLLMNNAPCKTFLGVQMTGANSSGAGGMGLGIPIDDGECKLDKAARLAFSAGNMKLGWELFCSQKNVVRAGAHQLKLAGAKGRDIRHRQAFTNCMAGAIDRDATMTMIQAELTALRATLIEVQALPGYDDAALRARITTLEEVAHLPNSSFLIKREEE